MPTWIPMFALPNIKVEETIEVDGMAMATIADQRLGELAALHPSFAYYLDTFCTEFGRQTCPSIIIRRDDTTELYRSVDALAGFRDAIALSVLPYVWSDFLRYGHAPEIGYSDSFSIYPWMLDKNYEFVVMRSVGQIALEEAHELKPQCVPGVTPRILTKRNIDRPLLTALLKRWPERYSTTNPIWEDRALFRSLNMANAAARLPANAEGTEYDIGRCISLWVSAFEILVHDGDSGVQFVYDNFEKADWHLSKCKETIYEPHGYKVGQDKRNLACWVYGKIHKARIDFLHGNPITDTTLLIPESGRFLLHYAPILYRMALTARLDLKWTEIPPDDPAKKRDYEERWFDFRYFQGNMEAALATALIPYETDAK
jgi:hypothetical protein